MRHRYAPLRHRAIGILHGDLQESLASLLVLEGVQQRNRPVESFADGFRARRQKVNRPNLLRAQFVLMLVLAPRRLDKKDGGTEENR
jgi:hypothetical protein